MYYKNGWRQAGQTLKFYTYISYCFNEVCSHNSRV